MAVYIHFNGWLVILDLVDLKFRELHSDVDFRKVIATFFLPTSLVSNKTKSKQKLTTVRKLSTLQSCCFAVCSRSCLYKTAIWAVQRFAAETHCSPIAHTQQWVLITCAYHLPFSCFLSMSFLLVTAVRSFSPLQCPWEVEQQEQTRVSCLTVFRRQSLTSWQLREPWGKGLRPPSRADVQQQLRSAVPSSSSSCNCYPLVSSSSVARSLCWIQPQAFCSFPRNYSLYPASQPQPSTLLITGSAVSPSTCPLWE